MSYRYKFEKYRDINFPVYSSEQQGSGRLVIPHFHGAAELVRITGGRVTVAINTRQLLCEKGDLLYIPPYCVHSIESDRGEARLQGIVFDFSLLPTVPQQQLSRDRVQEFVVRPGSEGYDRLAEGFSEGIRVYGENSGTYRWEMLSALYKITAMLLRHYGIGGEADDRLCRVQPVMDHIRENFVRNIPLAELSGLLHVCDDHLIRLFKTATNKTPVEYLMDVRLEEAMKLLVATRLPVSEIAARCGFSGSSYMARLFRSRLGTTPLAYRSRDDR